MKVLNYYTFRFLVLSILTSVIIRSNGQELNSRVRISDDIKIPYQSSVHGIIPLEDGGYLAVSGQQGDILSFDLSKSKALRNYVILTLNRFDNNLKKVNSVKLDLAFGQRRLDFRRMIKLRSGYFMLLSYENFKRQTVYLFAVKFNPNSLTFESDPVMIAEQKSARRKQLEPVFEIIPDSSSGSFAILSVPPQKVKSRAEIPGLKIRVEPETPFATFRGKKLSIWVYNDSLRLLNYRRNFRFQKDYENAGFRKFYIHDFVHDREGNIYILSSNFDFIPEEKLDGPSDVKNWNYFIKKLAVNEEDTFYSIDLKKPVIEGAIRVHPDGKQLVFIGLEGDLFFDYPFTTGITAIRLALENLSEISYKTYAYPINVTGRTSDTASYKETRRHKRLNSEKSPENILDYVGIIDAFFFDQNGTPVLIMEQRWTTLTASRYMEFDDIHGQINYNPNASILSSTIYYHYGSLFICKIGNDSGLVVKEIKKRNYNLNAKADRGFTFVRDANQLVVVADNQIIQTDLTTLEDVRTTYNWVGIRKNQGQISRASQERIEKGLEVLLPLKVRKYYPVSDQRFVYIQYPRQYKARICEVQITQ